MTKVIDRRKQSMGGGGKRKLSQIKNVAVHYSATKEGSTSAFENHWKNARKWVTGGYHEVVLLNGNVELNYDADVISNGVANHNTATYNICYVGDGVPNDKQLAALKERVKYNADRLGVKYSNVKGHREFSGASTQCPGLNMSDFRKSLTGSTASKPKNKTIAQMATEVIAGKHGNGHPSRQKSLGISDAEYAKVRAEVNKRAGSTSKQKPKGKSIAQMAKEVIDGKHGNGHPNRQRSLRVSDETYAKVRAEVNKRASGATSKPKKSISQMATEVIRGDHGTGHPARQKSLGVDNVTYQKVRAEVNKRL